MGDVRQGTAECDPSWLRGWADWVSVMGGLWGIARGVLWIDSSMAPEVHGCVVESQVAVALPDRVDAARPAGAGRQLSCHWQSLRPWRSRDVRRPAGIPR